MNKAWFAPDNWRFLVALVLGAVLVVMGLFAPTWLDEQRLVRDVVRVVTGVELPEGFAVPRETIGNAVQTDRGGELFANSDLTPVQQRALVAAALGVYAPMARWVVWLVSLGGLVIVAGAVLALWQPRQSGTFDWLIRVGALVAGLYFVYALGAQNSFVRAVPFTQYLAPTFWVALAASFGMLVRELLPTAAPQTELEARGKASVSIGQNMGVAFDALRANKLRSALTMLGIIIGVMSVVSLLSIGQGAQSAITDQISAIGTNLVFVQNAASVSTLSLEDADTIRATIDGLTYVVPQFIAGAQIRNESGSVQGRVVGSTPDYFPANNLIVEVGRGYDENEYANAARVAVIGTGISEELFGNLNPVGRTIRVNGQRIQIIGVMQERDAGFGADPNFQIYVPLTTSYRSLFEARAVGSSRQTVSSIILSVAEADNVAPVQDQIERLLRRLHNLRVEDENDFILFDQQQLLEAASTVTSVLTILLGAIAGVSLLVGGIGIMNISLVSVTERTREIGLRKALGARPSHILQQFLIETIVMSTFGGLLGVALGVGLAQLINASGLLTANVTFDSIALGLGFSVMVGVFFGVWPARRAASLQPIEALRYE
ncbi:MAG: ABC transporter permease [Anaerolineae bacterium]|nr:ABC transporter permease [Anaerolineae bacterium]